MYVGGGEIPFSFLNAGCEAGANPCVCNPIDMILKIHKTKNQIDWMVANGLN